MNALGTRVPAAGAILMFALLSACYVLSIDIRASRGAEITGDEPFYLLTTQSLLDDGDFDLRNQYRQQSYREFFDHPDGLWQQSVPDGKGRLLSPHNPGLSVYLIPGFWAGGLRGAQVQLLLTAALAFALTYVFVAMVSGHRTVAWLSTGALGLTATPFIYATEIYPEMPAALLLVAAILVSYRWKGAFAAVVLAALLSGLLWLGVKYAPLAAVVAGLHLWQAGWRGRLAFAAFTLPALAAYAWVHVALFGALTPYSVGTVHAGLSTGDVVGAHLSFGDRAYRLYGIFLDRRFGIARWAPLLFVALAGLPLLWNRRPAGLAVAGVIGGHLAMATFVAITMMGWWFPGRTMVTVIPLLALPLTLLVVRFGRPAAIAAAIAAAYSLFLTAALAIAGHAREVVIAVDPFELDFPLYRWPAPLFPQYTSWTPETRVLTAAWLAFALLVTVSVYRHSLLRTLGGMWKGAVRRTAPYLGGP